MTTPPIAPRQTITAIRPEAARRTPVGAAGQVLGGKYRLERRIATGGSASVWSATHVTLRRPIAVKFVDAVISSDRDERIARFLREAQVAASVRHKNVVDILDFGVFEHEDGAEPYMIMELLEGESLDDMLARGRVTTEAAVSIVRQSLSGLGAVHAAGIIHRDMKPGNVFISQDQDGSFVRVLDFGISQGSDDVADGVVVGTPEYMSPEQAFGDPPDRRTDIYSVGVMLYEMLAGFMPFQDPDPMRVLRMVVDTTPPSLAELRSDIPELCRIVERAMARDRETRFASAREMQLALDACLATQDAHTRAAITPHDVGAPVRRELPTLDGPPERTAPDDGRSSSEGWLTPTPRRRRAAFGALALVVIAISIAWGAMHHRAPAAASVRPPSAAPTRAASADPPTTASAPATTAREPRTNASPVPPGEISIARGEDPPLAPTSTPRAARARRPAEGQADPQARGLGPIRRQLDF